MNFVLSPKVDSFGAYLFLSRSYSFARTAKIIEKLKNFLKFVDYFAYKIKTTK
jgi:hypothetical protein